MIVLDMDSSESPTFGEQEGSAYNGHFVRTCYHPLFLFNQLGDVERCALTPGNVHSADGWRAALEPVIARYRGTVKRVHFRGDAAFANPEIYDFLASCPNSSIAATGSDQRDPLPGTLFWVSPPGDYAIVIPTTSRTAPGPTLRSYSCLEMNFIPPPYNI
jgi:hypothetical protein